MIFKLEFNFTDLYSGPTDSVSSAFYEARENVLLSYKDADHQFSTNIWTNPRLLFSYFKRPLGYETEQLVLAADLLQHATGKWDKNHIFVYSVAFLLTLVSIEKTFRGGTRALVQSPSEGLTMSAVYRKLMRDSPTIFSLWSS
jgi:hypothetical protein